MNTAPLPETSLSLIYQQARALATGDDPRPEEALALARAAAVLSAGPQASGGVLGPEADRVRRAVIVALRQQALAARRAWMAAGAEGELLGHASALAAEVLRMHSPGDTGREETEYLARFLRVTQGVAQMPARKPVAPAPAAPVQAAEGSPPPPPEPTPEREVTPPAGPAAPESAPAAAGPEAVVVGLPPVAPPAPREAHAPAARATGGENAAPSRGARPGLVPVLAGIAVLGFAAGVLTAPRLASRRESVPPVVTTSPAAVPVSARPAPPAPAVLPGGLPTPTGPPAVPATPAQAAAPGVAATPAPAAHPALVGLLLRSEPSGAQVFVGGALQGTTPLRLEAKPGTVLQVTVRRGTRVWRGTLRVGPEAATVTVRLPQPAPTAAKPPARPTATPAPAQTAFNRRTHYDGLLTQGIELYRAGWFGPAAARFRQATAVLPGDPRGYLWLARASYRAGRYAEARAALEKVIALAPGSAAAREAQKLLNTIRHAERGT